ncbi:MAG: nucleotidyltransferase family protein [Gudongella sp.]|nr:nucleotidyltransferase family protein [Gudongella sp.]
MKVEGIIIAAGKSTRMYPKHKLLLDLNGKTVIERSIESLYDFCSRIIVVTGHNPQMIVESIGHMDNLEFVQNDKYEEGMFSSIKAGLLAAKGDRIFLMPGDCPFVGREVFQKMLSMEGDILLPSFEGVHGHPVLLSKDLAARIREDSSSVSLEEYIEKSKFSVVQVDDPGILRDIDTPEDYISALEYLSESGGW